MDMGSVADWVSDIATIVLAIVAAVYSVYQYMQARNPELYIMLTNATIDENGNPKGYRVVAINNSESNSVVLENVDTWDIEFGLEKPSPKEVSKLYEKRFVADTVVSPGETETLFTFKSDLYYEFWPSASSGKKPVEKYEWFILDRVNNQYYCFEIRKIDYLRRTIESQTIKLSKRAAKKKIEAIVEEHHKWKSGVNSSTSKEVK